MKAIAQVDLNGLYVEDVLVEDGFTGLWPVYAPPVVPELSFDEEMPEPLPDEDEVEPDPIGYLVGIPVTPGFYLPKFDLDAWEKREDSETQKPSIYWSEGLTLEEIEELKNPSGQEPPTPTIEEQFAALKVENEVLRASDLDNKEMINGLGAMIAAMYGM